MKKIKISFEILAGFFCNGNIFKNNEGKTTIIKMDEWCNPLNFLKAETKFHGQENAVSLFYTGDGAVDVTPEFIKFDAGAKLRMFLYLLARDHLPLGVLEGIMSDIQRTFDCDPSWAEHWDTIKYEGVLEGWSDEVIEILMDTDYLFPDKKLDIKECVAEINKGADEAHKKINDINKEAMDDLLQDDVDKQSLKESPEDIKLITKDFEDIAKPSAEALRAMSKLGINFDEKKSKPKSKRYETFQDVISAFSRGDITVNVAREEFGYLPLLDSEMQPTVTVKSFDSELDQLLVHYKAGRISGDKLREMVLEWRGKPPKSNENSQFNTLAKEIRKYMNTSPSGTINKDGLQVIIESILRKE